jgi:hypothetical protein
MPIHDWTLVSAGTFHHFHQTWIVEISKAMNTGLLPAGIYAMAEQIAGGWGPDVLTLEGPTFDGNEPSDLTGGQAAPSAVALAERPPKVRHHAKAEIDQYARKASALAIRHSSTHKVIAMMEVVSPGNKSTGHALSQFVEKAADILRCGVHLMVVDLLPPGRLDPQGIHSAIWQSAAGDSFAPPADQPLTLASYIGGPIPEAYVEPTAVGTPLIDMPLFLTPRTYVPVPLETTYQSAWEAVPSVWRRAIEEGRPTT